MDDNSIFEYLLEFYEFSQDPFLIVQLNIWVVQYLTRIENYADKVSHTLMHIYQSQISYFSFF